MINLSVYSEKEKNIALQIVTSAKRSGVNLNELQKIIVESSSMSQPPAPGNKPPCPTCKIAVPVTGCRKYKWECEKFDGVCAGVCN